MRVCIRTHVFSQIMDAQIEPCVWIPIAASILVLSISSLLVAFLVWSRYPSDSPESLRLKDYSEMYAMP